MTFGILSDTCDLAAEDQLERTSSLAGDHLHKAGFRMSMMAWDAYTEIPVVAYQPSHSVLEKSADKWMAKADNVRTKDYVLHLSVDAAGNSRLKAPCPWGGTARLHKLDSFGLRILEAQPRSRPDPSTRTARTRTKSINHPSV